MLDLLPLLLLTRWVLIFLWFLLHLVFCVWRILGRRLVTRWRRFFGTLLLLMLNNRWWKNLSTLWWCLVFLFLLFIVQQLVVLNGYIPVVNLIDIVLEFRRITYYHRRSCFFSIQDITFNIRFCILWSSWVKIVPAELFKVISAFWIFIVSWILFVHRLIFCFLIWFGWKLLNFRSLLFLLNIFLSTWIISFYIYREIK